MSEIAYFNGEFLPKEEIRISPDDRGFLFADGVYDVALSYGGNFFRMDAHLTRLANGLRALEIVGVDVPSLAGVAHELLRRNGAASGDRAVYFQVTRGAAPRKHAFPVASVQPTVYATTMPFVRKGDPTEGTSVITVPDTRWTRCDIKSIGLIPNCMANQRAHAAGATEAIFIKDGVALEGTAASFFAVFDGVVTTAPNSNYILPGITRAAVLEICTNAGIPSREAPVFAADLWSADELFLAGTTTEVLSIIRLDGRDVGDGRPGPMVKRLVGLFHELVARECSVTPAELSA
ncbi:MAG: aminotransferase class IV [Gemmatimonadales bacterium]